MCEKIRISVFCFISQYSSCCLSSGNGPGVIRKQSFGVFRVPLISQECVVTVATVIFSFSGRMEIVIFLSHVIRTKLL